MKYKRMNFDFENNLEIYGNWVDLKKFFIDNQSVNKTLSLENCVPVEDSDKKYYLWGSSEDVEVIEWDENLMDEKIDMLYYVFLTKDGSPLRWLKSVAEKYIELEFNLVYQNRKTDEMGEAIYKNGKLYYNCKYNSEDEMSMDYNVISI